MAGIRVAERVDWAESSKSGKEWEATLMGIFLCELGQGTIGTASAVCNTAQTDIRRARRRAQKPLKALLGKGFGLSNWSDEMTG